MRGEWKPMFQTLIDRLRVVAPGPSTDVSAADADLRRLLRRLDARVDGRHEAAAAERPPASDPWPAWVVTSFRVSAPRHVAAVEQRLISAGFAVSDDPDRRGEEGLHVTACANRQNRNVHRVPLVLGLTYSN